MQHNMEPGGGKAAAPDTNPFEKKKSLGQNFLTSAIVPGWMCDAAEIQPGELVVEIGPGTGALTRVLLERGAVVIALEADTRAITSLTANFPDHITNGQLTLHHTDARTYDPVALGLTHQNFKVVANIPYYLTGFLFRVILEQPIQPSTLVFLIQKEVAERIARSQKTSLLSLSVAIFGAASYIRSVSRGHFAPQPAVDSAIIAVRNIGHLHLNFADLPLFFNLLKLGFGQKRKQLLGNLAKQYDRTHLVLLFQSQLLPPTIRAEDVDLESWVRLTKEFLAQSITPK